jgi:hypothetical protein
MFYGIFNVINLNQSSSFKKKKKQPKSTIERSRLRKIVYIMRMQSNAQDKDYMKLKEILEA